jgi:hypothetical protein
MNNPCSHKKIYGPTDQLTHPDSFAWICEKCGAQGVGKMECLYLSSGKCLHPDNYGQGCDEGKCPIPRRKL